MRGVGLVQLVREIPELEREHDAGRADRDGPDPAHDDQGGERRAGGRLRTAYRQQLERYLDNFERFLGGGQDARRRAILALSALVGAVTLSRAVDDQALADEISSAVSQGISELR